MFDFHACVVTQINNISPGFLLGKVVLYSHEHVECSISLSLAVLDALDLIFGLRDSVLELNTVGLALLKE